VTSEGRYGEREVTLKNDNGEVLKGVQFCTYPVDEPPVIEVPSLTKRLYRFVWEELGWAVTND